MILAMFQWRLIDSRNYHRVKGLQRKSELTPSSLRPPPRPGTLALTLAARRPLMAGLGRCARCVSHHHHAPGAPAAARPSRRCTTQRPARAAAAATASSGEEQVCAPVLVLGPPGSSLWIVRSNDAPLHPASGAAPHAARPPPVRPPSGCRGRRQGRVCLPRLPQKRGRWWAGGSRLQQRVAHAGRCHAAHAGARMSAPPHPRGAQVR
jgi:hypothetical protein